tara:strand:+ start:152 stop:607 length:456 start_codon:yes stop_codon:yes gene_type:complete
VIGKGGKARKKGKNMQIGERRELLIKEEGQEYGQILRLLGNGRLEANCFDGKKRVCTIRGKMRGRVWMNSGDIILVSLREFGDEKADVIHKYYPVEAFEMQETGEIPENININEGVVDEQDSEEDLNLMDDPEDEEDVKVDKIEDEDIDDI